MIKSDRCAMDLNKLLKSTEPKIERYTAIWDNKSKTYCIMDGSLGETVIEGSRRDIEFFIKGLMLGRTTFG